MADNDPDSRPANVNERTYQEVEYLKKNLGPVLVAALAEICIRRPADPIEYLGKPLSVNVGNGNYPIIGH